MTASPPGSGLTIEPIDLLGTSPADQRAAEAWYGAIRSSWDDAYGGRSAPLSLRELQCWAREESATRFVHLAARTRGGRVAGAVMLRLPLRDNTFQAFAEIEVTPGWRRRGIGSALLDRVCALLRAEGRCTVTVESRSGLDRPDVSTAFARRHGFTRALVGARNDLDLPLRTPGDGGPPIVDLDAVLAPLDGEVAAADPGTDYHVITYWDTVPPPWLEQRAHLAARLSTDAPLDDLEVEPEVWDPVRFTDQQRILATAGLRRVETLAVHTASGVLAGASDLVVDPARPAMARQWDTLVVDGHRGRRLGMWIKAVNLRALIAAFPVVRRLITRNAGSNAPMLRINRAMGYRHVGVEIEWQKDLTRPPSS